MFFSIHADELRPGLRGARSIEATRNEAGGNAVVFEDPYGNRWNLIQPRA